MKKIKRFTAFILLIILLLSACACSDGNGADSKGGADSETDKEEQKAEVTITSAKDIFENVISPLVDVEKYIVDDSNNAFYTFESIKEDDYAPLLHKIDIGDTGEVTLPVTLAELTYNGWVADKTDIELGYKDEEQVILKNNKDEQFSVDICNETEETVALDKCDISTLIIRTRVYDNSPHFVIDGKISNDSELLDVIAAFGSPRKIYCQDDNGFYQMGLWYYSKTGSLLIELSGDGSEIYSVYYSNRISAMG